MLVDVPVHIGTMQIGMRDKVETMRHAHDCLRPQTVSHISRQKSLAQLNRQNTYRSLSYSVALVLFRRSLLKSDTTAHEECTQCSRLKFTTFVTPKGLHLFTVAQYMSANVLNDFNDQVR